MAARAPVPWLVRAEMQMHSMPSSCLYRLLHLLAASERARETYPEQIEARPALSSPASI